jgi:hypothetical protein
MELEEDMEMQPKHLSNPARLEETENPPSWFPGWRQFQRLKNKWIAPSRSKDFSLAKIMHNGPGDRRGGSIHDARHFLQPMGEEVTEDLSCDDE